MTFWFSFLPLNTSSEKISLLFWFEVEFYLLHQRAFSVSWTINNWFSQLKKDQKKKKKIHLFSIKLLKILTQIIFYGIYTENKWLYKKFLRPFLTNVCLCICLTLENILLFKFNSYLCNTHNVLQEKNKICEPS